MADLTGITAAVGVSLDIADVLIGGKHSEQTAMWLIQAAMILRAIRFSHGNKNKAARLLQIHPNLLNYQMQQHALLNEMQEVERIAALQFELFRDANVERTITNLSAAFPQVLQLAAGQD